MKTLHLITVGKLKDKNLEAIENDYLKRIKNPSLKIHEVKASAEDKEIESQNVLKKVTSLSSNPFLIILTEFGKQFDSQKFSQWLFKKVEQESDVIFVICGAEGPAESLLIASHAQLSLSPLTYPHKLARILLVEQLYRALTIQQGHPYHN